MNPFPSPTWALCVLLFMLGGCAAAGLPDATEQPPSGEAESAWRCVENETAFGEVNLACSISADYVEGATVIMSYRMFCTLEPEETEGYVISRFSGRDFGGNLVGWQKRAEASFDGGPKEDILIKPLSDSFMLDREHFGYDSLSPGNFSDTVHYKVLTQTDSMLIRAILEPERVTTTSLFTWGDMNEPISFFSQRGCEWY